MREMKDSGLPWLGIVPLKWEVRKVKHYYRMQTGFTPNTKNDDFYDDLNGKDWVTIGDLCDSRFIPPNTSRHVSKKYIDIFNPPIVRRGSLLYSFKLSVGQVAFADRDVYTNEAIVSFTADNEDCLRFLFYSSCLIIENANENIYGAKLLNQKLIKNAYIVYPPLEEQKKIADFLDFKCSQIDSIIEKQKRIIEKLKEYKTSLITEVVTKGLDLNVEMKDSGIKHIGLIPASWKITKFKQICNAIGDGIHSTPKYDEGGDVHFINGNNIGNAYLVFKEDTNTINDEEFMTYKRPFLTNNSILISLNGSYGKTSFYNGEKILLGKSAGYITLKNDENKRYVRYYLQSIPARLTMDLSLLGSTVANLSLRTLKDFVVIYPSKDVQNKIVEYLDCVCHKLDSNIERKHRMINKLQEYKKSLIYEVVTGKREV